MAVLKYGMSGCSVRELQSDLKKLGYSITVDGSFGRATKAIVERFQSDNKLTVDGIAGAETQAAITSAKQKKVGAAVHDCLAAIGNLDEVKTLLSLL